MMAAHTNAAEYLEWYCSLKVNWQEKILAIFAQKSIQYVEVVVLEAWQYFYHQFLMNIVYLGVDKVLKKVLDSGNIF